MKNQRIGIMIVLALVAVAILLAVTTPLLFDKGTAPEPRQAASAQPKGGQLNAKGVVESEHEVVLSSRVVGLIQRVMIEEGDIVRQGQELVHFDKGKAEARVRQAEAELAEAKAQYRELQTGNRLEDLDIAASGVGRAEASYNQAKIDFDRQQRLYGKNATTLVEMQRAEERLKVTEQALREARSALQKSRTGARIEEKERAKNAVARAAAELEYQRALLADYTISSPLAGLVVEKIKDAGESTDIGTPVVKIIAPEQVRVRAELEETDAGKVHEGQPVEVTSDTYAGKVYKGKVTKVFPVIQKKTQKSFDPMASFDINTQKIHISLDDYSGLKNGMTLTVRFLK
ncbi:MAG: hypothetical protein A2X58_01210 [Nitrospirae bacterium GWC2_56_14]|nr:MAG: hypothetical protein A2X58_01210 [Nitrospirae bacterium GWC2_56_14]